MRLSFSSRQLDTNVVELSSPCAAMRKLRETRMGEPAIRPVQRFDALATWPLARIPSPFQSAAANIGRESQSLTCASVSQLWTQGTLRTAVVRGLRSCPTVQVAPAVCSQGCRTGLGSKSSRTWAGRLPQRLDWLDVENLMAARQRAPLPIRLAAHRRVQYL